VRAGLVDVGDDDRRALAAEPLRDRAADPGGGARHDRDLPLEPHRQPP
jgi:hypothetical protein